MSENSVFSCDTGAEKTRDELRKQVYDAMAEKEETVAADNKLKSEDSKSPAEVKKENGVAECPVKHVNGSEKTSDSPVNGQEKSSVQETTANGAEKTPGAPVNGVGESPTGSPGKENVTAKVQIVKEQNGEAKDKESKPEAEQNEEEAEGSRSLDTEHCWCGWV
ncbi:nuclear autoantigenic sperm protein-like [Seriola aureovittata]|uniref:nuclear autoantigenic sperm protein-like n=1 Tax=Seriola aureovittata TaxID=2871759 RepID=UPI0024BD6B1D|nr:nuclear autoantigenic sperm protein-like [Seriola aureovittata]